MNKAIFLVGGPGSGKDILLKNVLSDLKEYKIEQIYKPSLNKFFVVSSSACDYDKLNEAKQFLERKGYETAMIFVHVTEEISKNRYVTKNEDSETIRSYKYNNSVKNLYKFYSLFDNFLKFDNNILIENSEQFDEVKEFYLEFIGESILAEKKKTKKKVLKYDPVSSDNLMQTNSDRIPAVYDYAARFEDVPFSYNGYTDMPNTSGISRMEPSEPDNYRQKEIQNQTTKKVINRLKKIGKEKHGKRI